MPRNHARIYLSIWSDGDYLDLPMAAQWLYEALVSQPDINQAGILALTTKRWTRLCADGSARLVGGALDVLSGRRYVVIDSETEELLVRTFIRNDEIWRQPNTLKNACTCARAARSPKIRTTLRDELLKLDMEKVESLRTPTGHETAADAVQRTIKTLDVGHGPPPATPSVGYDDPNGEPNDDTKTDHLKRTRAGAGAGVGVRTAPAVEKNLGLPRNARGTRIPDDFAVTSEMVEWAQRECPNADGRFETQQFVDYWSAKAGKDAIKLDWQRTWQTWMRRTQRDAASRPGGHLRPVRPPNPLPADTDAAFADLRSRAAVVSAARLAGLSSPVIEPKPPSDPTDPREWDRQRRVEWLDLHEREIREALSRRVR